ncbi:MAG: hypothetical protein A2Y17_10515 [Clostridiales bacterium GWF2_38_85]|nr:MAG: hypothetical protein A2Y17_10515 [Clostridiales bacterium GWF2_38_85]
MYGVIKVELNTLITTDEQTELTSFINGQNSGGWDEGFEQQPINTDVSEFYVSFWNDSKDYFILPEEDFLSI